MESKEYFIQVACGPETEVVMVRIPISGKIVTFTSFDDFVSYLRNGK